jgi:hypothetical protein
LEQINGLENRKETTQIEKSAKSHKGGRRRRRRRKASDLWHGWPHAEKKRNVRCFLKYKFRAF